MAIEFENFLYSYSKKGKRIFVPNRFSCNLGKKLKRKIAKKYRFDSFVYHFRKGSHIAALHRHRKNKFFCRLDINRFFYSIRRNRIKRALKQIGIEKPEYFAKWSTVRNPYEGGGYVLPYGFVQSPVLATLVLALSPIGAYLRGLPKTITCSVYMDDLCLSGPNLAELKAAFDGLVAAVEQAGFTLNDKKTREPAEQIDIFNCSLANDSTAVLQDRVDEFYANERSEAAVDAFETYCDIVQSKTWRHGPSKKKRNKVYTERRKKAAPTTPLPEEGPREIAS